MWNLGAINSHSKAHIQGVAPMGVSHTPQREDGFFSNIAYVNQHERY